MIIQTICSFLVLTGIFVLSFYLEVQELGLASNLNAVVIVFGGTLFATLLAYPLSKLTMTARFLKQSFNGNQHIHWTIQTLVRLARSNKKGGVLALEREGDKLPKGLIRTGVGLMTYNFSR